MKHIVVPNCRYCPYGWSDYFRGYFMSAKCDHGSFHSDFDWEKSYKEIEQEEFESDINPDWCPLEEQE